MDLDQIDFSRLGERVVKAARLAVAMHQFESARDMLAIPNHSMGISDADQQGQRVVIGGAGPYHITEDGVQAGRKVAPAPLPSATRRSARPSRF